MEGMLKWTFRRRSEIEFPPKRRYSELNAMPDSIRTVADAKQRRKSFSNSLRSKLEENKENLSTNFFRRSFNNSNMNSPLQDLSNSQSPKVLPLALLSRPIVPSRFACTLPTYEAEESPTFQPLAYQSRHSPLNPFGIAAQQQPATTTQETSLSSSQIGDSTLDQLIDAILESAKKELPEGQQEQQQQKQEQQPQYRRRREYPWRHVPNADSMSSPGDDNGDDIDDNNDEPSIHEMEVKTPDGIHLKRQRVVRRKQHHHHRSDPQQKHQRVGLTLPNGIPSPETPNSSNALLNGERLHDLASMETPETMTFVVDSFPGISAKVLSSSAAVPQGYSLTPSPSRTSAIKRCLHFSPGNDDDDVADESCDDSRSIDEKRISVASANGSLKNVLIKGSIDLAIFAENGKLNVHVIRCRDLERPTNGSSALNAYVKVALLPPENEQDIGFQRTAVHRNSSRPFFDHRFKFDISDEAGQEKRIQLAVWHRDRDLKRSEFLGCLSFPVKGVIKAAINGSYKLQSQSCLTNPQPPILALNPSVVHHSTPSKHHHPTANTSDSYGMASITDQPIHPIAEEDDACSMGSRVSAATTSHHPIESNTGQPIPLSKKAIHQRDADENLFLRFLELDPPCEPTTTTTTTTTTTATSTSTSVASGSQGRRMSTFKPNVGRTPFTITKKLARTADRGYGFSIVWTHPPRVEKIEPGLSAEKNGILPGDYVIFVDKHNVVTMPEADVLNLIRSQGNSLTLEIFRRSGSSTSSTSGLAAALGASRLNSAPVAAASTTTTTMAAMVMATGSTCPIVVNTNVNGMSRSRLPSAASNYTTEEMSPALKKEQRSSTACSNVSIETTKRRLHLPQVTFSKESIAPCHGIEDQRRRILVQVITREQNFVSTLQFGMQRFAQPLQERRDLVSPNDHRTLFQNIDELIRISEDILEQLVQDDHETRLNFASRVYLSKTTAICAAYKKYCNGIKRADCVLVNKSRQPGSEFVRFITEPQVPRKRPDLTMFIHRPLQHFREILKLMQLLASHCRVDSEEHKNFTSVINELQAAYREITVGGGLMEPLGEGRPLLTLQDLEARMVFTRCKPFTLAIQGRQWIFGGDLSRVEGRSVKPYWTLLFSDILVFTKVSRDRVMFITEEPLPLVNIVDSCFNMRKRTSEFRLTVDPNGRAAESPTAYCAPDLSRTPRKNSRRKSLILRAPSLELKAVWQNLLQRQIFLVNAALGSTPLSSPLDSPDFFNTLVPLSDIGATTTSMASIKLPSTDSINMKNQQNHVINESHQFEQLIDEKCRILNKTGTPKGSALHLANWMKGQLDKQQEQARLIAVELKKMNDDQNDEVNEMATEEPNEEDERITFWTKEQLENRTRELNLAKENGSIRPIHPAFGGKRLSGVEEVAVSDIEDENKSPSRSTTSDSQITVRSSPIADKLSVCRHCHKNCKKKIPSSPTLLCNSLKVQHSQASPNRYCQLNSLINANACASSANGIANSIISISSIQRSLDDSKSNSDTQSTSASASASTITTSRALVGSCCRDSDKTTISSTTTTTTPATTLTTITTTSTSKPKKSRSSSSNRNFIPCPCKCNPEDFRNTTLSPDEVHHETCKLFDDASKLSRNSQNSHKNCKCVCKNGGGIEKDHLKEFNDESKADDDISLVLIGLAQLTPAAKLVNSDAFVPTISVVPPTPDPILSKTSTSIWDNTVTKTATATNVTINQDPRRQPTVENITEDSPDESPMDEEPPYKTLITTLRRYGTMSSLEKVASEEGEEEDAEDAEEEEEADEEDEDDDDIEVITREVFNNNNNNQASIRNWTARAGSYMAEKISFFEESRAFLDKYLGRWNPEMEKDENRLSSGGDEEQMEECTSGATSGEELWGTPTSGGENDEMNMQNSDHTQSSPTKSSSSYNGDDDTELMMDELLMAPPMTASTIRGLLPRRRLEPLFEEESESDEDDERPHRDDDEHLVKKGETSANGYDFKDSVGISRMENPLRNIVQSMVAGNGQQQQMRRPNEMLIDTNMPAVSITTTMTVKTMILPTTAVNNKNESVTSNASIPSTSNTVHIVRRAKFSPPPPPPRRLLLTQQSNLQATIIGQPEATAGQSIQTKENGEFGHNADNCFSVGVLPNGNTIVRNIADSYTNKTIMTASTTAAAKAGEGLGRLAEDTLNSSDSSNSNPNNRQSMKSETIENRTSTSSPTLTSTSTTTSTTPSQSPSQRHSGGALRLSPRLEMRLALNHDILGDEDLINYDPGPDLTTILGHDLSRFHRLTGRDLLNRSANRIQPREAVISYLQQRNSKIDTPTLTRKIQQQQQQQNQNIWNSSVSVDRIDGNDTNVVRNLNVNNSNDVNKLGDLELLARREKMFCMSQLKSGSPVRTAITPTKIPVARSTSLTGSVTQINITNQNNSRASRLFNFLTRRNSENQLSKNSSRDSLYSSNATATKPERRTLSPRKDNDKPSLNRRFWKQITKRRRSNSVSEITAS